MDQAEGGAPTNGKGGPVEGSLLFSVWALLRQTYMLMLKAQERSLAAHGVNFAQYMCLFLIRGTEGHITPTALAAVLSQETASVTYGLDRLEQKGLIVRTPGEGDRRETWLELTDAGRGLLRDANSAAWAPVATISAGLSGNEEAFGLARSLRKLRDQGAALAGMHVDALDFAPARLAPDPFIFAFWDNSDGLLEQSPERLDRARRGR